MIQDLIPKTIVCLLERRLKKAGSRLGLVKKLIKIR